MPVAQVRWGKITGAWRLARRVAARAGRSHMGLISAGVAFFGMFALFPALAALIAIISLIVDPVGVADLVAMIEDVTPPQVYEMLQAKIAALLGAGRTRLTWATVLSTGIALWSARAGVAAMIGGINAAHGLPNRGGVRHLALASVLTLFLVVVASLVILAVVIAPVAIAAIGAFVPIHVSTVTALALIRWIAALGLVLAGLGVLYRYGPNGRGARPGWITWGAVLVIPCWFAASFALSAYLANFGRFNEVYGSIGAVIAMQFWLYVTAYLVLLGAAVNAELGRPAT